MVKRLHLPAQYSSLLKLFLLRRFLHRPYQISLESFEITTEEFVNVRYSLSIFSFAHFTAAYAWTQSDLPIKTRLTIRRCARIRRRCTLMGRLRNLRQSAFHLRESAIIYYVHAWNTGVAIRENSSN